MKRNINKKNKSLSEEKIKQIETETKKYANYLEIPQTINKKKFKEFLSNIKEWCISIIKKIHKKGIQKITIMLIPHSESSILNLHINFYSLFFIILLILSLGIFSIVNIIHRSSQNIQYYDMGITNSQFYLQSSRLAEEIIPMHSTILEFAELISTIHIKLRIDSSKGKGGYAFNTTFDQIEKLKSLIAECKKEKELCSTETIENLLQISLNIAMMDNEILNEVNTQIKEINERIQSDAIKNFFQNIPTGLPVKGFIRNNYSTRTILERGNNYPLRGVEIYTFPNSPVISTANGKVVEIKYHPVFGVQIWIEHLSGIKTFYSHLNKVNVTLNQIVKKGDVIGYSGKTGKTNKNMLYYEVHIGTLAFNPHILINDVQTLWLNLQNY